MNNDGGQQCYNGPYRSVLTKVLRDIHVNYDGGQPCYKRPSRSVLTKAHILLFNDIRYI